MLTWFALSVSWSQQTWQLSGTIRAAEDGEILPGVSVLLAATLTGTSSNEYGFYSLAVPAGDSVVVSFSFVGFQTKEYRLFLQRDTRLDVVMSSGVELEAVDVVAEGIRAEFRSTQMSAEAISAREVKMIPVLLGETDILKAIQLKPGMPSGGEGVSGLFVRGGGSDQNLILLDEAVVYNPSHLFGFFSTFNTDAVKDLKLYKGGFPSQYGGRLSSVIDVRLQDGNNQKFSGAGGLGLLSSRLTLEGPIVKSKSSFIVSGRRTYADLFTRAINEANAANGNSGSPIPNYYFYDLNGKMNFQIGEKDRLYLSGYLGRDRFSFPGADFSFNFDWGNATGTLRWNHIFSSRLFSNTSLTFSDYQYDISNNLTGFSSSLGSRIQDGSAKMDFYYAASNSHQLRMGVQAIRHLFTVGRLKAGSSDGAVSFSAGKDYTSLEGGVYISDDWTISSDFSLESGLRWSSFLTSGAAYSGLEPRIAARLGISPNATFKMSYARMIQYLHLVANAGVALPTDVWFPSTSEVRPQASEQLAFGWSYLPAPGWTVEIETYYKKLKNQLEFVDGAQLFVNDNLEQEFAIGRGRAYGLEFSVERKTGDLTGWVGYTLARVKRADFAPLASNRIFSQQGTFSPVYDRRHNLSVVLFWAINRRWTASGTFVYGSGDLRWLPVGRFSFQDVGGSISQTVVPIYQDRNNFRIPAYHRLDVGLSCKFFPKWGESDLTLSVVNAYDRRNVFFIFLEPAFVNSDGVDIPVGIKAKQVSLFPILPALSWNFKF